MKSLETLITELQNEAWHEGFYNALYNHTESGHTLDNKKKIDERKKICTSISSEILEHPNQ